jgi:CRISPR-associated exonuclease Cas4
VDCSVWFTLEGALEYFRQLGEEVFALAPGIYAREWKEIRVWPSLVGDYLYCPRLVWVQARLGLRLMAAAAVPAAARGIELHRRYQEWLRRQGVRMAPVRIDAGWVAAEIDAVIERDGYLVPVEVKSTPKWRPAHELQLQAYMWLINAPAGYLVYPDAVAEVRRRRETKAILLRIDRIVGDALGGASPPPPGRDCAACAYREACGLAGQDKA